MIAFPQFELQFNRASNLVPKVLGRVGQDYGNEVECSVVTVLYIFLACSQTLYFLFKVRRARMIKNKNRGGFVDRQPKVLGVGEEKNSSLCFFLSR